MRASALWPHHLPEASHQLSVDLAPHRRGSRSSSFFLFSGYCASKKSPVFPAFAALPKMLAGADEPSTLPRAMSWTLSMQNRTSQHTPGTLMVPLLSTLLGWKAFPKINKLGSIAKYYLSHKYIWVFLPSQSHGDFLAISLWALLHIYTQWSSAIVIGIIWASLGIWISITGRLHFF